MSYTGKSPKLKRVRFTPQSVTPVNPAEGDLYYSDGTVRAEGLWYYKDAAWQVVVADNAILTRLTMDSAVLDAQSSDPGSPDTGEIFYSDGTARAAGLWVYNGTDWVRVSRLTQEEFYYKTTKDVDVATTANITIATALNSGDILNGRTLANGDRVLVKDQTVTEQNGVYVVSATPARATDFDTAAEITYACVNVKSQQTSSHHQASGTLYFQNNIVTTLGVDAQSWSTSMTTKTFTVPAGTTQIQLWGVGGGGGGGGGGAGRAGGNSPAAGGGGGAASVLTGPYPMTVTPGQVLTITIGKGGAGGAGGTGSGAAGSNGAAGTSSSISGGEYSLQFYGCNGTAGGLAGPGVGAGVTPSGTVGTVFGAGGTAGWYPSMHQRINFGGDGAAASSGAQPNGVAGSGGWVQSAGGAGGAGGSGTTFKGGGGGGGGGGFLGVGGAGGAGNGTSVGTLGGTGAGHGAGGGGGGGGVVFTVGHCGGPGGNGYVKIVW